MEDQFLIIALMSSYGSFIICIRKENAVRKKLVTLLELIIY